MLFRTLPILRRSRSNPTSFACLGRFGKFKLDGTGTDCGQVAQVVERSPEKAGVGGSTPSLATMFSMT
jgi:hypothetical protein